MEQNRWTSRSRTPERLALRASEQVTDALTLMLDESLRLDAEPYPPLRAVSAG